MANVTTDELKLALKAWEHAREKADLQRDKLGGFLKKQRDPITRWENWLNISAQNMNGLGYQQAKAEPGNAATANLAELQGAIGEMIACRQTFMNLQVAFMAQQFP